MKDRSFQRFLITGATGFMGHHVTTALAKAFDAEFITVGRRDADLRKPDAASALLRDVRPDVVVHLAARSGGILTNRERPADFFYDNLVMNTHVFHAAFEAGVSRFLTFIGGCSYPAQAPSPIDENQMWRGYPQAESAPYALAKAMMLVQSDAYRRQHGFHSTVLIPGNAYGEGDNFNLRESHVVPALIRKFIEAREAAAASVTVLGTGTPTRDFVYAGDVAALVPWFLTSYKGHDPVNISSGRRISIRELAETVGRVTGFEGEISWDRSAPDGQQDKIFDVGRLHALGLSCPTPLEEGLRRTVAWFETARASGGVRL